MSPGEIRFQISSLMAEIGESAVFPALPGLTLNLRGQCHDPWWSYSYMLTCWHALPVDPGVVVMTTPSSVIFCRVAVSHIYATQSSSQSHFCWVAVSHIYVKWQRRTTCESNLNFPNSASNLFCCWGTYFILQTLTKLIYTWPQTHSHNLWLSSYH